MTKKIIMYDCDVENSKGNILVARLEVFTSAMYFVPGLFCAPPCGNGIIFSIIEQPE